MLPKRSSKVGRSKVKVKTKLVTWLLWVQRYFTLSFPWLLSVSFSDSLKAHGLFLIPSKLVCSRLQTGSVREPSDSLTEIFQRQYDSLLHLYKAKCLPWHFIFKREISCICSPHFSLSFWLSVSNGDVSSCSHFFPKRGSTEERTGLGVRQVCTQPSRWPRSGSLCPSQGINFLS